MDPNTLEIQASIQIGKPPHEVFEAIVNPEKMSNYFISDSTGRLEEGQNLIWHFPEFTVDARIAVAKIRPDEYISYRWDGEAGNTLLVEMELKPGPGNSTIVTVTEKDMPNNEEGIKWLKGNTEGWANFLACLKAYLEYGINLRKGAFDYRSDKV
jgi:uncharacterized protein YndB with AHSA1/START domain